MGCAKVKQGLTSDALNGIIKHCRELTSLVLCAQKMSVLSYDAQIVSGRFVTRAPWVHVVSEEAHK